MPNATPSIAAIIAGLGEAGYIAGEDIAYAVAGTIGERTPLLIEGAPGCGKTFLARALADMLELPLIRVQMYDGITYDKILYDYDYQRQLLTIEAIRGTLDHALKGSTPEDAMKFAAGIDFYGKEFLIQRPILRALTAGRPTVLLLDEIDKVSEELEYALLEVLDEFSLTIPQYGTIRCEAANRPLVLMTSNNYRELSDALKRRCNFLYIEQKTEKELQQIIARQAQLSPAAAAAVAHCLAALQEASLRQTPSVAEGIAWANYVATHPDVTAADAAKTAFLLAKNAADTEQVATILEQNAATVELLQEGRDV